MLSEEEKKVVEDILAPYLADPLVTGMKNFIQHGAVNTYDHCIAVAYKSYEVARDLRAIGHIRLPEMIRAALLHDFYLYDWHEKDKSHAWHGFHHAKRAKDNAVKYFAIGPLEQSIIESHMWPLNLTRVPRSREAWIVTIADKIVASRETLLDRKKKTVEQPEKETAGKI